MSLAYTRRNRRPSKRVKRYLRGGDASSTAPAIGADKLTGNLLPGQESSLTGILPTTTWGYWANYPGAIMWSKDTQAPPPLANGGLYTGPQSTGPWASTPFPATQYGEMVEAAKTAQNPEVFFHQRPNDNTGASFSPMVAVPLSNQHYSAEMPAPATYGGGRRRNNRNRSRKARRASESRTSRREGGRFRSAKPSESRKHK